MSVNAFSRMSPSSSIKSVSLGEVIEFRNDIVHPKDMPKGIVTFVGLEHIERDTGVRIGFEQIRLEEMTGRRARFFKGDIVYGYLRPYLNKVWIAEFDGICSVDQYVFKVRSNAARNYVAHYLRSQTFLRTAPVETTPGQLPRIRSGEIASTTIPLPPLDEQKRIAAILDQADNLRRLRQRAIDRLNELGQAIFYEMFGNLITNTRGYEAKPLGSICDVRDGTHNSPKYVDKGYPLLTSKNFSSGRLSFEGAKLISEADYEDINKRSKVDIGDIIMPMIGTIGSPVIVNVEPQFAIKNVALLKLGLNKINAFYLKALLAGDFFEKNVSKSGRGGTQKFVSLGDLRALKVPVPPIEEQQNYAKRIASLEAAGTMQSSQLHAFEAFFSCLQHRAFTNQL